MSDCFCWHHIQKLPCNHQRTCGKNSVHSDLNFHSKKVSIEGAASQNVLMPTFCIVPHCMWLIECACFLKRAVRKMHEDGRVPNYPGIFRKLARSLLLARNLVGLIYIRLKSHLRPLRQIVDRFCCLAVVLTLDAPFFAWLSKRVRERIDHTERRIFGRYLQIRQGRLGLLSKLTNEAHALSPSS